MELRHLRYFVAVAEELSFTRAAQRLHIGQPPLSQAIQALEHDVGATLLDRSRRWVRLTDAGRMFLNDAREILALASKAADTARRAEIGQVGDLRIGFNNSTPLTPIFSDTINSYRSGAPLVRLHFSELPTMQQIDAIRARTLDVGFLRPPETPVDDDIRMLRLRINPLRVFTPLGHRLSGSESIAVKDLRDEQFVMFRRDLGTTLYPQIQRMCHLEGFEPIIAMEVREVGTIIGLVAAGCGIAILPDIFERIRIENVAVMPLADPVGSTDLLLAHRSDETSAVVTSFVHIAARTDAA